jgi:hydroxyacylglutathione hydrolase
MFQRFYEEGLAQASFLIGCDRTRQALVIDPRRDAFVYVDAARQAGMTLAAAVETHVHADFVSGARELFTLGVRVITGPGAGLAFAHHEAADGETMTLGDLRLRFLHTPGHTFEHITVLAETPGEPARLFTGDLLFVGGVGRPDLLGDAPARELAGLLFDSLQRITGMDAEIEVHPGHGAGSLCGAGIGQEPSSTIGRERQQNALLRETDRARFVEAVLGDLPETPPYFARMKQVNLDPPLLGLANGPRPVPSIRATAAAALAADGATIIDLRSADAFAAGHPDGAIHLAHGSKIGYWGGWVIPPETPLLLLAAEAAHAQDAAAQLRRVGLDRIEGAIDGGFQAWSAASLPVATIEQMPVSAVEHGAGDVLIVDVRSRREWEAGHLPGAINIPVGEMPERARELPRDRRVATVCEAGYRSSLAASLLAQEGHARVVNLVGGMSAVRPRD